MNNPNPELWLRFIFGLTDCARSVVAHDEDESDVHRVSTLLKVNHDTYLYAMGMKTEYKG